MECGEGAHERYRDADRYPERHPCVQEDQQDRHHQEEPAQAVLEQQRDAFAQQVPDLVVENDLHSGGPGALAFLEPPAHCARRFQAVGIRGPAEQETDRGAALVAHRLAPGPGAALDDRHVTQAQQPALVVGEQRQLLEARLPASLLERAQAPRHVVLSNVSGRQVPARHRDPSRDRFERHVELVEHGGRNLDRDLLLGQSRDVDLRDPAGEQLALDLAHHGAKIHSMVPGRHEEPGHRFVVGYPGDLRLLRRRGQVADRRHPLLHALDRLSHVGAFLVLERDPGIALRRGRCHLPHLAEAP